MYVCDRPYPVEVGRLCSLGSLFRHCTLALRTPGHSRRPACRCWRACSWRSRSWSRMCRTCPLQLCPWRGRRSFGAGGARSFSASALQWWWRRMMTLRMSRTWWCEVCVCGEALPGSAAAARPEDGMSLRLASTGAQLFGGASVAARRFSIRRRSSARRCSSRRRRVRRRWRRSLRCAAWRTFVIGRWRSICDRLPLTPAARPERAG